MDKKEFIEEMNKAENGITEILNHFDEPESETKTERLYLEACDEADEAIGKYKLHTNYVVTKDELRRALFIQKYAAKAVELVTAELREQHIVMEFVAFDNDGTFYDKRLRFLYMISQHYSALADTWIRLDLEYSIRQDEARRNAACAPQAQG